MIGRQRNSKIAGICLLCLGGVMLAVALCWPWIAGRTELMSEKEAAAYTEATMEQHKQLHAFAIRQEEEPNAEAPERLLAAQATFDTAMEKQIAKRNWLQHGGTKFRWAGVALTLLGVVMLTARSSTNQS